MILDDIFSRVFGLMGLKLRRIYPKGSIMFADKFFNNKKIIAVEVGVFEGVNAKSILKNLNIRKLYLIDPYEEYSEFEINTKNKKLSDIEIKAHKRLRNYQDLIWLREYSENAIKRIKEKVDFIYIDGNHDYDYVKKDLENYWEILNDGGILAGHDFELEDVSKALSDFIKKKDLTLFFWKEDWWIIKDNKS